MSKVKKIGILTFGQGINIFINILFMPYMARALSYELYGTYGQVLFIVSFLAGLLNFGLPQIITNAYKNLHSIFLFRLNPNNFNLQNSYLNYY